MKKLLHVIDSLGVGGAETLLVNVINASDNYEHHLVIINGPEDLRTKLRSDCRFTNLDATGYLGQIKAITRLRSYIRDNAIDIVHSHLYLSNVISRFATPGHIPLFNTIHAISSLASYKVNRLSLFVEKLSYKKKTLYHSSLQGSIGRFSNLDRNKGPVAGPL